MSRRRYKRKPGDSRLLWKEHLKQRLKAYEAHGLTKRDFARLASKLAIAALKSGVTSQQMAEAGQTLSFLLRGGNFASGTMAGTARITAAKDRSGDCFINIEATLFPRPETAEITIAYTSTKDEDHPHSEEKTDKEGRKRT